MTVTTGMSLGGGDSNVTVESAKRLRSSSAHSRKFEVTVQSVEEVTPLRR